MVVVTAFIACSRKGEEERSRTVVGGPCEYQSYSGTCRFKDIWRRLEPDGSGSVTLVAHFAPESGSIASFNRSLVVREEDEAAMRTWLATLPPVPCHGSVIVSGTCNPEMSQVDVPPFVRSASDAAND